MGPAPDGSGQMTTIALAQSSGQPPIVVTIGVLDSAARRAYGAGQCHALAVALASITGWRYVYLGTRECEEGEGERPCRPLGRSGLCFCQVDHVAVAISAQGPDDADGEVREPVMLDIKGLGSCRGVAEFTGLDFALLPPAAMEAILADPGWPNADRSTAAVFA